jgi:hypothetical protein
MMKRFALVLGLFLFLLPVGALANTLQIQFSGLDLTYNGSNLCTTNDSCYDGGGDIATGDSLANMTFWLNGVQVGSTLSTNIGAGVNLNVGALPMNGTATGTGGVFDLLTDTTSIPGWGLALNVTNWTITDSTNGGILLTLNGSAASSIYAQDLPFGLALDAGQPVAITFSSSSLTSVANDGTDYSYFNAAGTGNVTGTAVPEPGTLTLMGTGLLSLAGALRRKLKKA